MIDVFFYLSSGVQPYLTYTQMIEVDEPTSIGSGINHALSSVSAVCLDTFGATRPMAVATT